MFEVKMDRRRGRIVTDIQRITSTDVPQLVAEESVKALKGPRTLWPVPPSPPGQRYQRTGDSKRGFNWRRRGGSAVLTNLMRYAVFVNFRRTLNGGGRNPNYLAIERTINKEWRNIIRRVRRRVESR